MFKSAPYNLSGEEANKQAELMVPQHFDTEDSKREAFENGLKFFKSKENEALLEKYKDIPGMVKKFPELKYEPVKGKEKGSKKEPENVTQ